MLGSSLSLVLLGLGAVQAAPTKTTNEPRQSGVWGIGDPKTSLWPGDRQVPPGCNPYIWAYWNQCIKIGAKRQVFTLPPGADSDKKHAIEVLELQLEALQNKRNKTEDDYKEIATLKAAIKYLAGVTDIEAPPGTGSTFTPGKAKRQVFTLPPGADKDKKHAIEVLELQLEKLQNKRVKTDADLKEIASIKAALLYLAGITDISAPPGTGTTFTPGKAKRQVFTLPPGADKDKKHAIEVLELQLEKLQNKRNKTDADLKEIASIKAALLYLAGITDIVAPPGGGSTFTPGRRQVFTLPPGWEQDKKHAIEILELQLQQLQNKPDKTDDDLVEIATLKAAIKYLAGVTEIVAPPGGGSTFTPGKRQVFTLPPGWDQDKKHAIEVLELQLEQLQNKRNKTDADLAEIASLKAAIKYLAGVTEIVAPPGGGSTFTPGRRGANTITLPAGDYASVCPGLKGAELAYEGLLHATSGRKPTVSEYVVLKKLERFLEGCGVKIIESPDGTTTVIYPSGKRDAGAAALPATGAEPGYALAGLELAYGQLLQGPDPDFTTWLALAQIADVLALWGVGIEQQQQQQSPPGGKLWPRQTFTIGEGACELARVEGLKAALRALQATYGDPKQTAREIYLIEQFIATAIRACGQEAPGWTTLKPGPYVPGGPLVPGPYIPGGPLKPDPYVPGGPLKPDPYVPGGEVQPSTRDVAARQDASALLGVLRELEAGYGALGEGSSIPGPIFLIMQNVVFILQDGGVTVPGWPILGPGTVVIGPSN